MITTSDTIVLLEDTITMYRAPKIYVEARLQPDGSTRADVQARHDTYGLQGSVLLEFTSTATDVVTGAGSEDREKYGDAAHQLVKAYLLGLTANAGATFTIV